MPVLVGSFACGRPTLPDARPGSVFASCDPGVCKRGMTCVDGLCISEIAAGITESHPEPREFLAEVEQKVWRALLPDATGKIRCPGRGDSPIVDTGMTPPADVHCHQGPAERCIPGAEGPGGYPLSAWDHPTWAALEVRIEVPHRFHYQFKAGPWKESNTCAFTTQAFGDLDDDGTWSTYERSGVQDSTGPNAAAGLYIDFDRAFE